MNMQQIMAQAQRMQNDIMKKKGEIDSMDFIGKSEWIEVNFKGNREIQSVKILSDDAFDKNNSDILCDMLVIAIKDAMKQIEQKTEEKLGSYSKMGGLF